MAKGRRGTARKPAAKEDKVYEVEHILGLRRREDGIEVFVKWTGYSYKQCTWEPIDNCGGSENLLSKFSPVVDKIKTSISNKQKYGSSRPKAPFEVEDIVGIYWDPNKNKILFTLKWVGFPHQENTDEPLENLDSCQELLEPLRPVVGFLQDLAARNTPITSKKKASPVASGSASSSKKPGPASKTNKNPIKKSPAKKAKATPATNGNVSNEEEANENDNDNDNSEEVEQPKATAKKARGRLVGSGVSPPKRSRMSKATPKTTPSKKTPVKRSAKKTKK